MLGAEREVLAARRVLQAANLLEKELRYIVIELRSIGMMAALFSGFVIRELNRQGSTRGGNPMLGGGGEPVGTWGLGSRVSAQRIDTAASRVTARCTVCTQYFMAI